MDPVAYSIENGNSSGLFEIDAQTGELFYVGAGEDYEADSTPFYLTVRASDGTNSTDTTVTVNVGDVQEAPAFGQESYEFTLAENTDGLANRVSLGAVTATDPDDDPVAYSIEGGNASGLFEIDAQTGELFYVGAGEDYEAGAAQFDLTIRASDGTLTADAAVSVAITDVPEQTIVVPADPEILQSVSEPNGEDLPANTSTIGRVAVGGTATGNIGRSGDRDGFAVELVAGRTYIIDLRGSPTSDGTLNDPYLRGIKGPDGRLIAGVSDDDGGEGYNSQLNLTPTESGPHYIIAGAYSGLGTYEVEVRDISPQTAQQETTNGPPAFGQASYAFTLAENADGGTDRVSLGTVTATDPDDDPVAYSIEEGNESGSFAIDAASGELFYVGAGEDYEAGAAQFDLTIRASDGTLTADAAVSVAITDVPEQTIVVPADPEILQSVSEPNGEDFPANTSTIGRVAVDGTVTSKISRSGDRDWFAVELVAGGTYTFDLRGSPTGDGTLGDPHLLGLHDAQGNLISGTEDNDGGEGYNSRLTLTASETGTYYIAAGAFSGRGTYELEVSLDKYGDDVDTAGAVHVGGTAATGRIQYEGDRDWFAVTLEAGKTYLFDMEMDSESAAEYLAGGVYPGGVYLRAIHNPDGRYIPFTWDHAPRPYQHSQLAFKPDADGTYYVEATSFTGSWWTGDYTFRATEIEDDFAASTETTGTVVVGGSAIGEIEYGDDRDWFAVELEADKTYQIDVHGEINDGGTLNRAYLYAVYDDNGNKRYDVYDHTRLYWEDSQVFFTPDQNGTYYLSASNNRWLNTGTYTVRVAEIEDDFPATVDTTGSVDVGGISTGEVQYEGDHDWFAVELTAGDTYKIELLGTRSIAGTLQDPYIRGIHDADGRLISDTTDYSSGPNANSEVLFTPNADGTYHIAAGSFITGQRDQDVGTYTLQVSIDDFRTDTGTTGTVAVGGSVTGEIEAQADQDWFAVTLEAGKTYQIDMEGSATDAGTLANPYLRYIRDADGNRLFNDNGYVTYEGADSDSGEGLNARATFTPDEDATYYVVAASGGARHHGDDSYGRSLGTYTLAVEELVDAI